MHTVLVVILIIAFLIYTYYVFWGDRAVDRKIKDMCINRYMHREDIQRLNEMAASGEISIDEWQSQLNDIYEGKVT